MKCSKIIAIGSYLPPEIITNDDLANKFDTSDEWISSRTGIKQRHIADVNQKTSDLASLALLDAVDKWQIDKSTIDAVIVATTTPDAVFPATAAYVQKKAGLKPGIAFDLNAVCSGFVYAYITADSLIRSGQATRVAVIGADTMSRIVDWDDRSTCVLFGDGAGVVILEGSDESPGGLLASKISCDSSLTDILDVPSSTISMNGREVYRHAVEKMSETIETLCQKAHIAVEEIDWLVAHQANVRIIESIGRRFNIDVSKVVITVDKHANTSAASIPLALDNLHLSGRLKRGQKVAIVAAGAGFTWGGGILTF